jgi:3-oxoacyl-[acyl-carrier protein] reductase
MVMPLKGKIALVLGAVKGIGKEIGLALAKEGATLVLTRYDWEEEFRQMEEDFAAANAEHMILTVDLRSIRDIERLSAAIGKKYGRLDILINNIERGGWPSVHGEYTEDQWDLEIETTLKAKRWVFFSVFPLLKKADGAAVINISSIAALIGRSGPAALVFNDGYAAANRGVSSLTETWARMGAPTIRVNELMLGIFDGRHAKDTRGWREVLTADEKKSLVDHTLLGRTGRPDDIVNAILFLIKDAPYMTGSVIRLDGGYVLGGEIVPPMPKGAL